MHLRRWLADLERIGHPRRLDSSAGLIGNATSRDGKRQNQDRQHRQLVSSISRVVCKKMIHRRDFVSATRDLSTYRFARRDACRWLIPRLGGTRRAFSIPLLRKQVYALLEVPDGKCRRQEILLPMRQRARDSLFEVRRGECCRI